MFSIANSRRDLAHRLRMIPLALAIVGSLIPGMAAPLIPAGSAVLRSVATTTTAPVFSATELSYRQLGNCGGGGGPCP